jgi:hypothetical protein
MKDALKAAYCIRHGWQRSDTVNRKRTLNRGIDFPLLLGATSWARIRPQADPRRHPPLQFASWRWLLPTPKPISEKLAKGV